MYLPFCVSLGFLLEASSGNIYERSTLNLTLLHILSDGKQNKNNNNNVSKLSIQNPMLYYILFQKNIPGNGRSLPGPHHPCKFLPAPFARRLSRGAARARIDSRREGKGREGKGREGKEHNYKSETGDCQIFLFNYCFVRVCHPTTSVQRKL